jgi:hypothetical protein
MNNEVERYVGELRELREKVKYLEAELAKHKPKVRVSGVPYEVEMIQDPLSQEPDRYTFKER